MRGGARSGKNRASPIYDSEDPRRRVAATIAECDGNIMRSAHFLGVHRSRVYQLIEEYRLWPVVNEARRRALERRRAMRDERWIQAKRHLT